MVFKTHHSASMAVSLLGTLQMNNIAYTVVTLWPIYQLHSLFMNCWLGKSNMVRVKQCCYHGTAIVKVFLVYLMNIAWMLALLGSCWAWDLLILVAVAFNITIVITAQPKVSQKMILICHLAGWNRASG